MRKKFSLFNLFFRMVLLTAAMAPPHIRPEGFSAEEGLPFVSNYTRKDYAESSQNWAAIQDRRGIMYFANTNGVLEYDGNAWRIIYVSNESAARSLAIDSNGRIYVGAQNEFGYLETDSSGKLRYVSLLHRFKESERSFSDILRIMIMPGGIYLQSPKYIFCLKKDTVLSWYSKTGFYRAQKIDDAIYVQESERGLAVLQNDRLQFLHGTTALANERVYAFFRYDRERIIIFTRAGSFLYDGKSLKKHLFPADRYLSSEQIYSAAYTPDGHYAFSTTRGGVVFTDKEGNILNIINQAAGLNDDNVRSLFFDREQNLWACMNNGIAKISYRFPLSLYNESHGLKGSVQNITRHRNTLYAATSQGVFYLIPKSPAEGLLQPRFERIRGIESQAWSLLSTGDVLLAGTNDGIFRIENNRVQLLQKGIAFVLYQSRVHSCIFIGFQNGLGAFEFKNGSMRFRKIDGIGEEVRSITEDEKGSVWIGTRLQYTLRADFNNGIGERPAVYRFDERHGLTSSRVFALNISGKILFTTSQATFWFDPDRKRFFRDSTYTYRSDTTFYSGYTLKESHRGEIWMLTHENKNFSGLGYYKYNNRGDRIWHYKPFIRLPADPYYCLHCDASGAVWAGGPAGIIRYVHREEKDFNLPFSAFIRKVSLPPDSALFFGTMPPDGSVRPALNYENNTIRFQFAAASYDETRLTNYQFWLEGFEKTWSEWQSEPRKEYTNLSEGNYVFHLRARNVYKKLSDIASFEFTIQPPGYRAWWAYIIYAFCFIAFVTAVVHWRSVHLRREKQALEQIIGERTAELKIKKDQLEKINRIVQTINSKIRVDEFLNSLINEVGFIEKAQHVAALILDPVRAQYQFMACRGWLFENLRYRAMKADETVEWLLQPDDQARKDIYQIQSPAERFRGRIAEFSDLGSILVLCIQDAYQISGFLVFGKTADEDGFNESDIQLLSGLRSHILSGFMKAQLLTHLESMNEELKKLNDQKSEFLGIAAHDLRNPLGAIIGYLDLMLMDLKMNTLNIPDTVADIEMVLNSARQMVNLITELLDISAIESGKIDLEIRRHSLNPLLEECERIHKKAAEKKRIRLIIDRNEQLPDVMIDRSRIVEVVDNLLSNAIKFTYPEGTVRLYADVNPGEVCVHVQDSGQGLNDNDLNQIFRSFKKLSARPTGGESSTGFGLAIVKKIVELHNGRVWVDSKVNEGSTFSFSVPIQTS